MKLLNLLVTIATNLKNKQNDKIGYNLVNFEDGKTIPSVTVDYHFINLKKKSILNISK